MQIFCFAPSQCCSNQQELSRFASTELPRMAELEYVGSGISPDERQQGILASSLSAPPEKLKAGTFEFPAILTS